MPSIWCVVRPRALRVRDALAPARGRTTTRPRASPRAPQRYVRSPDPDNYVIPGGESQGAKRTRVLAAVRDIFAAHAGEVVCVVSHGGALAAVGEKAAFDTLGEDDTPNTPNCSIGVVESIEGSEKWKLISWGDNDHLRTAELGDGGLRAYEGAGP